MFVVFEKNGAIFLVSLCPIAKSSTTKSRFARLDQALTGSRSLYSLFSPNVLPDLSILLQTDSPFSVHLEILY